MAVNESRAEGIKLTSIVSGVEGYTIGHSASVDKVSSISRAKTSLSQMLKSYGGLPPKPLSRIYVQLHTDTKCNIQKSFGGNAA